MREDMFEVIIERPRRGGRYSKKGRFEEKLRKSLDDAIWLGEDAEAPITKSPMRDRSYDRKSLNENLSPLKRFLDSAVGRLWDDVYSEVREHLNPNSAVQKHVIDHLKQYVITSTCVVDGIVGYYAPYYPRGWVPLEGNATQKGFRAEEFYVHPVTKLLCVSQRKRYRWSRKPINEWIYIDDRSQFRKVDDVWYRITLGHLHDWWREKGLAEKYLTTPYQARGNDLPYEAINFGNDSWGLDKKLTEWERKREFGSEYLYSIEKRQCGKRELKLIKLALDNGGKLP